ncbi:unnamed protein product, partial [Pleuronectes platessa]
MVVNRKALGSIPTLISASQCFLQLLLLPPTVQRHGVSLTRAQTSSEARQLNSYIVSRGLYIEGFEILETTEKPISSLNEQQQLEAPSTEPDWTWADICLSQL